MKAFPFVSRREFPFVVALIEYRRRLQRRLAEPSERSALYESGRVVLFQGRIRRGLVIALAVLAIVPGMFAADPLSNWTTRVSPYGTTNNWKAIAFGNGRFVAVSGSAGLVLTSTNGTNWEAQSANTNKALYGIAFGDGKFVAAGASGLVMTSSDGAQWQPRASGTSAHLYSASFHGGTFVVAGSSGLVLSSTIGTSWTPHNTGSSNQWRGSAYGNGTHVIVGYRTQSGTSHTRSAAAPALSSLQASDTGSTMYLSRVTFGNGKFVACGYGGQTQTSTDGTEWTGAVNAGSTWLFDVRFHDGVFVAVGEQGKITSSTNGLNWTSRRAVSGQTLNGVAFGNNTWVAVGDNGLIVQSDPIAGGPGAQIVLSEAQRSGTHFSFRFTGIAGQSYQVQATTNLVNWDNVASILCTNASMSCLLSGQTNPRMFYRVTRQ